MSFKCIACNYIANNKFNYDRHIKSIKHLDKINEESNIQNNKCEFCGVIFTRTCNLSRHMNTCNKKKTMDREYENIKMILEKNDQIINAKDDTIAIQKAEIAHLKSIVNSAENIVKTSISSMAYVIKNYTEAPALEIMTEYEELNKDNNNEKFVRTLIYEYKNRHLDAYIGDFIIKIYKKEDPAQQSIWNSDTNRLTYAIRNIIANNKTDWKIDKKGIKVNELIIAPIVNYIDEEVRYFVSNMKIDYESVSQIKDGIEVVNITSAILKIIELHALNKDISRYIAPYFYIDKTVKCTTEE